MVVKLPLSLLLTTIGYLELDVSIICGSRLRRFRGFLLAIESEFQTIEVYLNFNSVCKMCKGSMLDWYMTQNQHGRQM